MRRALTAVFVLLFACTGAHAKPRHWYTNWKWYAGAGVIVGSLVADRNSTCAGFRRGFVEAHPPGAGSRSCGEATAVLALGGASYLAAHAWSAHILRNDPSAAWRAVSLVTVPAVACAFHCTAAARNYAKIPAR